MGDLGLDMKNWSSWEDLHDTMRREMTRLESVSACQYRADMDAFADQHGRPLEWRMSYDDFNEFWRQAPNWFSGDYSNVSDFAHRPRPKIFGIEVRLEHRWGSPCLQPVDRS